MILTFQNDVVGLSTFYAQKTTMLKHFDLYNDEYETTSADIRLHIYLSIYHQKQLTKNVLAKH